MIPDDSGIVLYSCYFGDHEPLNINCLSPATTARKIVFTDHADLRSRGLPGDVECIRLGSDDPRIASRLAKICPHLVLPNTAQWAIYVDNRAYLKVAPETVVQNLENQFGLCPDGRYLFRHDSPRDPYRELRTVLGKGLISQSQYEHTKKLFQKSEMPRGKNLYVNTMMVQKMGDASTDRMNEHWLDLFSNACPRDQPILPYVMFKYDYPERIISKSVYDYIQWPAYKFKDRRRYRREALQARKLHRSAR
ncbi:hypothetical protein [Paracoccus albus]|uniref:hypothetical protein n=1 Tax=Paracoccus albus TaxID=3017784 RepID=UPI0022F0472B|nr:hypothetical protein [Paracoccus albus]WBU59192.1 hypothetical protein PAF20_10360 [Paracoccus albus]